MIIDRDRDDRVLRIVLRIFDNWHTHFRKKGDPRFLPTVEYISRFCRRANGMGNHPVPTMTAAQMLEDKRDVEEAAAALGRALEMLSVIMIGPDTTPRMVEEAIDAGAYGVKIMPANGTTNSAHGLNDYRARLFRECLAVVRDRRKAALFHAEVPDLSVPPVHRERLFIPELEDIRMELPDLKICVEHISDAEMVRFVLDADRYVAATVTPHHMEVTEHDADNDVHLQCMPYPKYPNDVEAVRHAVMYARCPRFFYGSDNAPHLRTAKERVSPKPASGVFTAPVEPAALAHLFDRYGCLPALEPFTSEFGAAWHGFALNEGTVTLERRPQDVPEAIDLGDGNEIVPYKHGRRLTYTQVL